METPNLIKDPKPAAENMETPSLIKNGNMQQESSCETAEKDETINPYSGKEVKQEPYNDDGDEDDNNQNEKSKAKRGKESNTSPVIKRTRTRLSFLSGSNGGSFKYCEKHQLHNERDSTEPGRPLVYIDNAEDSSLRNRVMDKKDNQLPEKEKVQQLGLHEEIHYCVQGYLPVSKVEYLQMMPGDGYLNLGKQNSLLDGLPEDSGNNIKKSVYREKGDSLSGISNSHSTSFGFVGSEEQISDIKEVQSDGVGTLQNGDSSTKSDQVLSSCDIKTEPYVAGTSCGLQKNGETKKRQRIRNTQKTCICDVCFAGFPDNGGLNRHKRIHTGEKPYKCDICGVAFAWSGGLKTHRRVHTGEKPYKCDVCGVFFASCSNLKTHKRTHTGEKPFPCGVCDARFTRHSDLDRHKRTHTGEKPFKCDICQQEFTGCSDLIKHTRVHTGEKPYKCDVCGNGFSRCCSLNRHKRIHTGEKPYKCDVCGAEFARCSDLTRHKKKHTGGRTVKTSVPDDHLSSSSENDQFPLEPSIV